MIPIIIGLTGKIGSGKTSVANALIDIIYKHNTEKKLLVIRKSFGDEVKKEVSDVYDFDINWCYSQETKNNLVMINSDTFNKPELLIPNYTSSVKEYKCTVRELMQFYGTDYVRKYKDYSYWIDKCHKSIKDDIDNFKKIHDIPVNCVVIIDDVRFPNELCFVKSFLSNITIRINPYVGFEFKDIHKHDSEISLDDAKFDMEFYPKKDINEIQKIANDIYINLSKVNLLKTYKFNNKSSSVFD